MNDEHKVTVSWRVGHDGNLWYKAACSCGKYKSGMCSSPGKAESCWRDHAKAKLDGR